ncbi:MAG: hypothetical protein M1838_002482 [Thelocarpon superellum]|nr:MAG: hypothetical protein M1838_002482 [Thelocarpon superellum]
MRRRHDPTADMPERRSSTSRIRDFIKSGSIRRRPGSKEEKDGSDKRTSWTLPPDGTQAVNGEFKAELDGGLDAQRGFVVAGDSVSNVSSNRSGGGEAHGAEDIQGLLSTIDTTVDIIRGLHERAIADFDVSSNDATFSELHWYGGRTSKLFTQVAHQITNPVLMAKVTTEVTAQAKAALRMYQNVLADFLGSVRLQMEQRYRILRPEATDAEVDLALRDVSSRNYSVSILRVDEREEIQPLIRAVEKRSRAVNVTEQTLRELEQVHDDIVSAEAGLTHSFGLDGLIREFNASECIIAPLGDMILVFEGSPRAVFQVSSQALSAVSPLFSYALNPYQQADRFHRGPPPPDLLPELPTAPPEKTNQQLPPFLRMPQVEMNEHGALGTLFYAAHARHDKVPRSVTFREFVAIAAVCHRYRCTAPVEIFVECFWLPQWQEHLGRKGYEDFLFISYVFGLDKIFELTSKSFILHSRAEKGPFEEHNLPSHVWHRLNQAKALQFGKILERCNATLSAYLPVYNGSPATKRYSAQSETGMSERRKSFQLARATKCPMGNHSCDAMNLGWLMLMLNEVGVPHKYSHLSVRPEVNWIYWQGHNLEEIFAKLCGAPSAPSVVHDGCDFAAEFRNAMCDIYNGIRPLNVREVNERFASRYASALNHVGGPAADEPARQHHVELARLSNGTLGESSASSDTGLAMSSSTYQAYSRRTLPSTLPSEQSSPPPVLASVRQPLDMERRSIVSAEVDTWTDRCASPAPTMASTINVSAGPTLAQLAIRNSAAHHDESRTPDASAPAPAPDPAPTHDLREADKIFWKQHAHKERITIADKELIISRKHILRIGEERGLPPLRPEAPNPSPATSPSSAVVTTAPLDSVYVPRGQAERDEEGRAGGRISDGAAGEATAEGRAEEGRTGGSSAEVSPDIAPCEAPALTSASVSASASTSASQAPSPIQSPAAEHTLSSSSEPTLPRPPPLIQLDEPTLTALEGGAASVDAG